MEEMCKTWLQQITPEEEEGIEKEKEGDRHEISSPTFQPWLPLYRPPSQWLRHCTQSRCIWLVRNASSIIADKISQQTWAAGSDRTKCPFYVATHGYAVRTIN